MSRLNQMPLIAITAGDPSGIGSEIILKALSRPEVLKVCRPVVVGSHDLIQLANYQLMDQVCSQQVERIQSIDDLEKTQSNVVILDVSKENFSSLEWGVVKKEYGQIAKLSLETATQLALSKKVDAIVTAPVNKEALSVAHFAFKGHTDYLSHATKSDGTYLMLMVDEFRVIHTTLHIPLNEVSSQISQEKVLSSIVAAKSGCEMLGVTNPKIGVCGLNPHAGENGILGNEEKRLILPAIKQAAGLGISVEGPLPADVIFSMLKGKKYDCVVAMYHDQGGVAMKTQAFEWDLLKNTWGKVRGVNISVGLPIIRTSVSHGTAFEIAGKGVACEDSLVEAIDAACVMVESREGSNIATT